MKLEHLVETEYKDLTDEFSCPTVFEPGRGCPADVMNDIRQLWADCELGNDNSYQWVVLDDDEDIEFKDAYPALYSYLKQFGITECMVHWSW